MGLPIEKEWMDAILRLSRDDRIELIALISDSLRSDKQSHSGKDTIHKPWHAGARPVQELSKKEWLANLNTLSGAWSDMPDDIAEQIIGARTISTREINLDD
jgi:hypothetical protein